MTLRQLIRRTENSLFSDLHNLADKELVKLYKLEQMVVNHLATLKNSKSESRTKAILAWKEFLGAEKRRVEGRKRK